jgi:hypothetical protein
MQGSPGVSDGSLRIPWRLESEGSSVALCAARPGRPGARVGIEGSVVWLERHFIPHSADPEESAVIFETLLRSFEHYLLSVTS